MKNQCDVYRDTCLLVTYMYRAVKVVISLSMEAAIHLAIKTQCKPKIRNKYSQNRNTYCKWDFR